MGNVTSKVEKDCFVCLQKGIRQLLYQFNGSLMIRRLKRKWQKTRHSTVEERWWKPADNASVDTRIILKNGFVSKYFLSHVFILRIMFLGWRLIGWLVGFHGIWTLVCYLMANHIYTGGCPRGVMVKAMDCGIVVSGFVLQSRYYVHFRANTTGKDMNPLILPARS